MSHIGKDEYFAHGLNESIHNIVITQMTKGNWKSGRALMVTTSFYNEIKYHKRWKNEFHDFFFTFSDTLPQEIDWKW